MSDKTSIYDVIAKLEAQPYGEVRVIVYLREYVDRNPQDLRAAMAYGSSLRVVGRWSDAIKVLEPGFQTATSKGLKAQFAFEIAMAMESASLETAERWFEIGTTLDGTDRGWAWVLRGANLARLERFDDALNCYQTAMKLTDVDKDEVLKNIVLAYRAKGDYRQALVYAARMRMTGKAGEDGDLLAASFQNLDQIA